MALIWITSATYLDGYCLQLTFNNGEVKIFDGKDIVTNNPMFHSLQVIADFKDFMLDGWTVSWQNGKIDIAPEFLYKNSQATKT